MIFNMSGGGSGDSKIIVHAPTGSTVTCSKDTVTKTALEENNCWTFFGCDPGVWTVTATRNDDTATKTLEILEDNQMLSYSVSLAYWVTPEDLNIASYGTKGVDYEVYRDDGTVIEPEDYWYYQNWNIEIYTSGDIKPIVTSTVDLFAVGGGGGGGFDQGGGGGGGFTATENNVNLLADKRYNVEIGAGGAGAKIDASANGDGGATGGTTSVCRPREQSGLTWLTFPPDIEASGGSGGTSYYSGGSKSRRGGSGGSGGGGGGTGGKTAGNGGSEGSAGTSGNSGYTPGSGQGTTTRAFGETTGKLYAGGGGGGDNNNANTVGGAGGGGNEHEDGEVNTGGGGGGGSIEGSGVDSLGGDGGSGILIIRNARGAA